MTEKSYDERCLSCRWFIPDKTPPCGKLFEIEIFIHPFGGKVNISLTPGFVPEEMEPEVEEMLYKVFERVADVINKWPGWAKIADIAEEKNGCPGREERLFAKAVKLNIRRIK